jgi:hypothetical protein
MTKLSMGDFRLPILKSLATLAPVGTEVPYNDLLTTTLASMALALDAMGTTPAGHPGVTVPVNNCLFDLKQRGCVTQSRRGVWALTQTGSDFASGSIPYPPSGYTAGTKAKAAKPATKAAPAPSAPTTPTETTEEVADRLAAVEIPTPEAPTPEAPAPAPVVLTETVEEVAERIAAAEEAAPATPKRAKSAKLAVIPAADAPAWVSDNYLRGLVAANTACFGQYSPNATSCSGCAIAPWCKNAQAAALSVLASKLLESEKVSAATSKLHTETAAALSPSAPRATVTNPPRRIPVQYDGVCARTGAPLTAGSVGYYVPGEGICSESSLTSEERASITEGKP